ncbi:MAG: amidohydrolase family protein [Bryobacteraceae bacterium]
MLTPSTTRREALALSALSVPLLRSQSKSPASPGPLAFTHTTVIDGTGVVLPDHTVVVSDGHITAVGQARSVAVPAGANVVDGRGRFIIPGLWDAHAHLSYFKASALPVLLANGVTSVRDMGGLLSELDQWRTETDGEIRPGPRIFRAGPIVNGKQFNEFQIAVTDAAEARGAVRALQRAGVDFIKVHAAISREAYFGVRDECQRHHLPFAGHMPRAITPEEASDAGELTLEHAGAFADRIATAGLPAEDVAGALARFRQQDAPALFGRFAKNNTWFTPTLIASQTAIHLGNHRPDQHDRYVSASCKKITAELLKRPAYQELVTPASSARQQREFRELLQIVELMHREGVQLLAGTDFAISFIYPGFSLHDELALLGQCGLTPMQALQTATRNPARVLGQDKLGTIEPGTFADLVILDADPLASIQNTRRIQAVVTRGKLLSRPELDQLLEQAEIEARQS